MLNPSFERFREIVFENEHLQAELLDIADRKEFIERVVILGAANGCDFRSEDVEAEMREAHRAWIEREI